MECWVQNSYKFKNILINLYELHNYKIKMMLNLQLSTPFKYYAKQNLYPNSTDDSPVSQLLLIQKQADLISQIERAVANSRKCRTGFDEISDFSTSTLQNSHMLSSSKSTFSLHKDQNSFCESSLEEVLNQIKRRCSKKAYCFVREKFRAVDQNRIQSRLQKEIKYNQQLMRRCLKLSHEISELKGKLEEANERIKMMEKNKMAKQQSLNVQKGEIFVKWEKSMLHKEKLQAEVKKYLNRQFCVLEEEKKLNENIRQQINFMLEKLEENGKNSFDIQSFTKEVKSNLDEQRELAKKQQSQFYAVQKQVEIIFKQLKDTVGLCK